jgi:NitT/TauT family transport system substrate-binding protein
VATAIAAGAFEAKFFYGFNMRAVYDIAVTTDIASVDDLRGQPVGVSGPASQTDLFMRAWLTSEGLDPDTDVTILAVGGTGERVAALSAGHVKAAPINSSLRSAAQEAGGIEVLLPAEDNELAFASAGVVASQAMIDDHPGCVAAMARALDSAMSFMADETNRDAVLAVVTEHTGLEGQAAEDALDALLVDVPGMYEVGGPLDDDAFATLLEVAATIDPNMADLTPEDLVDTSFTS